MANKAVAKRENETEGQFFVRRYAKDPERFCREVLGVEHFETWQSKVLADVKAGKTHIAVASGHGVGKTALTAWLILWFLSTRPNPQADVTANTKPQLDAKTWRELALWRQRAKNHEWFSQTATKIFLKDAPDTWFCYAMAWTKNRSEAFAGTHGKHVLRIFDEASAIDDVIWEVSEGAMTQDGAYWFVFGNPTRNTGRFRECWGKFRNSWTTYQVDSREVSFTKKENIEEWIRNYGEDSDFVRVRIKGEFPRSGMWQFISLEDVERCQQRTEHTSPYLAKVMGIDLARAGACNNTIYLRQGRKAWRKARFQEPKTNITAGRIVRAIEEENPDAVFIDGGGIGGPIIDLVKSLVDSDSLEKIHEVNGGERAQDDKRYHNKRAEMWGECRDWLHAGADIPDDNVLRDDLIGPEYLFDNRQRIQLERKEDMLERGLASPDDGDALCLTFAQPVLKDREEEDEEDEEPVGRFVG